MTENDKPRIMKRVRLISETVKVSQGFYVDFKQLNISSHSSLENAEKRSECPQCKKKCMYFCYYCFKLLPNIEIPHVECPLNIHIVRHPREKPGKSSAIPLYLLAPNHIKLYSLPNVPRLDNSVLLFPSNDAEEAETMDWEGVDNVLIIDCTWYQVSPIMRDETIKSMRKIKFSKFRTANWRYITTENSECYLSTVETAYYISQCKAAWVKRKEHDEKNIPLTEECQIVPSNAQGGVFKSVDPQLDNMLWFFSFFHRTVMDATKGRLELCRDRMGEEAEGFIGKINENRWHEKNEEKGEKEILTESHSKRTKLKED